MVNHVRLYNFVVVRVLLASLCARPKWHQGASCSRQRWQRRGGSILITRHMPLAILIQSS